MSNFDTLSNLSGGTPGLAARVFTACTEDDQVTVTAAGYVNDLAASELLKQGDVLFLNTQAFDEFSLIQNMYRVEFDGIDYNLILVI